MTVFKADGTGKVALYSGTDDAPFTNPRANISRVHFHSEFDYIAFDNANIEGLTIWGYDIHALIQPLLDRDKDKR